MGGLGGTENQGNHPRKPIYLVTDCDRVMNRVVTYEKSPVKRPLVQNGQTNEVASTHFTKSGSWRKTTDMVPE